MTASTPTRRRAHYVLSIHQDREWYQAFQDYRYRLVQAIDRILAGMADGRLKGPFQTDGQSIILDDYLEVRPERRAEVERLAREGKLVIGPWLVLPDEFLVSGESLIRNIRIGREIARSYGGIPSNAGFLCDLFGHNSQMPQIFAGFGIQGGFIWRGTNNHDKRNVRWKGADGTELICYRFGQIGYCTYAVDVRHAGDYTHQFELEQAVADFEAHLERAAGQTEVSAILVFDGCDHQEWDAQAYQAVDIKMQNPDAFEVVHTSLDAYLQDMLQDADKITTTLHGELREPGYYPGEQDYQWVIPGVLSSRVWIKQQNTECETLLCHLAEPMSAFAHACLGETFPYPQGFLNTAWKWLIQNHPHDSICGCSIDIVHEDMKYRFSQTKQIASRLTAEATRKLAASIAGSIEEGEMRVVVFNPLPHPVSQTVELTLEIPITFPTFNEFFGFEPKPAFRIFDADGREIPYQRLGQSMLRSKKRIFDTKFPQSYKAHDIKISLPLDIPALGYTTLMVRQGEKDIPTRYPAVPGMATGERSMENEFLAVTIEANGTLTLTDKRSHQRYERLLTFEDTADIGDGWYYGMAANDISYVSAAAHADVALVHNGPMLTTFRVRTHLRLPAEFHFDSMTRSEKFVELVADSLISLRPGSDALEIETTIDNQVSDHRLRVLFPSGAKTDWYESDTPFDVVERPIALSAENHTYRELEVETKPQHSWTAVYDNQRGLAVIADGLKESAVRDLAERPIALTLFRSTRRTVFTDGEPNGQIHGMMTFRYRVVPLAGAPNRAKIFRQAQQLAAGFRDVQLVRDDAATYHNDLALPLSDSFLAVEGDVVVTSVRRVDDGLEVRLFNPATTPVTAILRLNDARITQVQPVNLESQPAGERLPLDAGSLAIALTPKQIRTLRFS